jgi:hypothetical protein
MPDSIRDPFKLRFARDPIRAIEIEFHFLKAYMLASKPQDQLAHARSANFSFSLTFPLGRSEFSVEHFIQGHPFLR